MFASAAAPPPPHTSPPPSALPPSPSAPPVLNPPEPAEYTTDEALRELRKMVKLRSPSAPPPPSSRVIYEAPFANAIRRMKLFSLTSCVLSALSSPIYLLLAPATVPMSGRLGITVAVLSFSFSTTIAFTKMTHSYLTRVYLHPQPPSSPPQPAELTLETLSMLARPHYHQVSSAQLRPLFNRLITNVRALGVGEVGHKDFYFHVDLVEDPVLRPIAVALIEQEDQQQQQHEEGESDAKERKQ